MQPKMNLIILGDASVGKTSLLRRLQKKKVNSNHIKTIAIDSVSHTYVHPEDQVPVNVKIWDTAG